MFIDINECSDEELNDCDTEHGACLNDPGTYRCLCVPGFEGDGTVCTGQ